MSAPASPASACPRQRVQRIKQLAAETPSGDGVVWDDPGFRERVALAEVQLKALELTQLRVVAAQRGRAADKPDPRSSILKIKGSELQQTTTELLLDLAGPFAAPLRQEGLGNEPPEALEWAGTAAPTYFNWRKVSIYGGSNEIQRNIIAKAILGF